MEAKQTFKVQSVCALRVKRTVYICNLWTFDKIKSDHCLYLEKKNIFYLTSNVFLLNKWERERERELLSRRVASDVCYSVGKEGASPFIVSYTFETLIVNRELGYISFPSSGTRHNTDIRFAFQNRVLT